MKKIHALFSSHVGDGNKVTFITTGTLMEINHFCETNYHAFKDVVFVRGECEIGKEEFNDVDTREWYINGFGLGITVKCTNFPIFN